MACRNDLANVRLPERRKAAPEHIADGGIAIHSNDDVAVPQEACRGHHSDRPKTANDNTHQLLSHELFIGNLFKYCQYCWSVAER
ncbi:MAG: hypothetical protein ACRCV5_09000, partial [Afipia sp.]